MHEMVTDLQPVTDDISLGLSRGDWQIGSIKSTACIRDDATSGIAQDKSTRVYSALIFICCVLRWVPFTGA